MGAGYHTGTLDLALADRFRMIELLTDRNVDTVIATNLLTSTAYATKLSDSVVESTITKIFKIASEVDAQIETGSLQKSITIRHILEVITTAISVKDIKMKLFDLCANLVNVKTDGRLDGDQLSLIRGLIKTHYK
jgi:hypothetical protein